MIKPCKYTAGVISHLDLLDLVLADKLNLAMPTLSR